ncbi:MAG TPA: aminopeptidase P family protein [Firmicutes bacterium]|jgi:Xaa-Pro aminopeptidase|nr:aminopeptidase P family protein [Bacillota bacterium]
MTALTDIRAQMQAADLDALVVSSKPNRTWLTGFHGSAGTVVITPAALYLLVDFRYIEQAKVQAPAAHTVMYKNLYPTLREQLTSLGVKRAGFESSHVVHKMWQRLQNEMPDITWVGVDTWIEAARGCKRPEELAALEKAVVIADQAFAAILPAIKPGITESDLALELEFTLRRLGAERMAFDIITASGVRGALPHGAPTDKVIERGDLVTLDFGAVWQGYHSDITRTVAVGNVSDKQREIYELVLAAQLAGIAAVAPGKTGREVDAVAREMIAAAGYGERFGHGLGHGVGLEIHEEYPRLAATSEVELKPGMVCSVEPGVYIPGWGGVRIEDMVVVTESGCRVLTTSPKELLIV